MSFVSAGPGGLGGGLTDWLYATLTANQSTNIGVGTHVEWNTEVHAGTSISLATGGSGQANGLLTLAANNTYLIVVNLRLVINEGVILHQWVDDADDTPIVDVAGVDAPIMLSHDEGSGTDSANMDGCVTVYSPTVQTTIKCERVGGANLVRRDTYSNLLVMVI